jgi:23S rRNA pseudouridine2457 synthase
MDTGIKLRYYVIYKPYGMLSQFTPEGDHATLGDLHRFPKNVYPVGRLDAASEGLLLLTNDITINKPLLDPVHGHHRSYYVQVDGQIDDNATNSLMEGVTIRIKGSSHQAKALNAKIIEHPQIPDRVPPVRVRKKIPTSWLELTIGEGKNHQVRKMTAKVNFPTIRLIRFSIGQLTLDFLRNEPVAEIDGKILKRLIFNN